MGCIDASRRQLQSVLKIWVKTDFFDEVMAILVLPVYFWILSAFSVFQNACSVKLSKEVVGMCALRSFGPCGAAPDSVAQTHRQV